MRLLIAWSKRIFIPAVAALLSVLLPGIGTSGSSAQAPPNVLFIAVDDLNNDLAALGVEHIHTPNLDAVAAQGRLFTRHFIAVPSCGPSRAALLRGQRPSAEAYLGNNAILATHEEWGHRSLPAWFRSHGYTTLSLGKITHYPGGLTGSGWAEGPEELPGAWDRAWVPESPWATPEDMMHGYANGRPRDRGISPAWEAYDGSDEAYPDAWVASDAIQTLESLAESDRPWFFAVGFFKPHLPFAAPRQYFDLYDPHVIPVPSDTVGHPPPSSWHVSAEMMANYGQHPADPRSDEAYARQLRHAYAASTSYVDAQIGRVLGALDRLGMSDNTIVVIWSDHGFALGHQGIWGKHSVYEAALKAPLIIRYPGLNQPGAVSDAVVEAIDLYPTLTDLAGIPTPDALHGRSLRPQLEDPAAPSSRSAFAFYNPGQNSVRTEHWRLILHQRGDEAIAFELFDFRTHPDGIRRDPGEHSEIVDQLRLQIESLPWFAR
jgi:iduronate 2-sulfatase